MPTTIRRRPGPPPKPTITGLMPDDLNPAGQPYGTMIIDQVTAGVDIVNAAQAAGVTMAQLGEWTREGQINYSRYLAGAEWNTHFTPEQQDAVDFHWHLSVALAQHKSRLVLMAEQLARGGLTKTTTRVKTVDGRTVESHTTTETLLPDAEMLRWKLERLQPEVYGRAARLDVMVHDLTDSDERMSVVEQRVEAIREQMALRRLAAIDTTATD